MKVCLTCLLYNNYNYIFFSILLIYGGLGVGVLELGSWIGFLGLVFGIDGVWDLKCAQGGGHFQEKYPPGSSVKPKPTP